MIASGASQDQIKEVNFGAREKSEEWKKRHQPDVEMDDIKAFFFFFRFTSTLPNTSMVYVEYRVLWRGMDHRFKKPSKTVSDPRQKYKARPLYGRRA